MKIYTITRALLFTAILGWSQPGTSQDSLAVVAMSDDTSKVNALLKLGEEALRENFGKAKKYAEQALALSEELSFEKGIYKSHKNIGRAAYYLSDNKLAFEHYEQAYTYYKKRGDKRMEAAMLNRMGETKRLLDEYEKALEYFQSALSINRELGDTNEMGSCYIGIGILYIVQGNEKEAENYLLKAIESFRSVGNAGREHLTILNLGGLYRENGEFEKSIEFSLKARDYFLANGPEIRLAIAYYNLGVAYYELNQLEESKRQYLLGYEIFERLGDKMRNSGIIMRLSEIALKQGQLDLALSNAQEALKGFEEIENQGQELWAFQHISNIYKEKGDYKQALEYRVKYEEMLDSVNSKETKSRIAEIEEKYQSELKDQQLEQARSEIELNALILQKQQNQKYAFLGVAIFVLAILLLLLNQYRIKNRNNETLREKNKLIQKSLGEKEVLLKEIHHRVKNNLQFISSLLNLQSRHVSDPQTLAVLVEGKNLVQSMALVHQKLYQEENLKGVHMSTYVQSLVESLVHSYKIDRDKIDVRVDIEEMYLDVDTAIPVGMILNELITNVFKYAFKDSHEGSFEVTLIEQNNELKLRVGDNGKGLPKSFQLAEGKRFGFELIKSLVEKMKGELETKNEQGAVITITIRNYKKA